MVAPILALIAVFLVQETFTTNIAVVYALHEGVGWDVITIIWFLCTLFDLIVPYIIGRALRKRQQGRKKKTKRVGPLGAKTGKMLIKSGTLPGIIILSIFNFTYINVFFAAWLKKNTPLLFLANFLGNVLWYLSVMALSIAALRIFDDIRTIILVVGGVGIFVTIVMVLLSRRMRIHR